MFCKKCALKNFAKFTGKHLCQNLFLLKSQAEVYNFIKKETLTQVFSHKFCEIFKNTFCDRTLLVASSESRSLICQARTVWATPTKYMQRSTLLFMGPEQLPGKYPIKQAKQYDLPNHGSFWQSLLLLHNISMGIYHRYKPFIFKWYLIISATTCWLDFLNY